MIRAKKGFAYMVFMVVAVFILLVSMITVVLMKENKFNYKGIGDIQLSTIQTYQTAEATLFEIDQAAKYTSYKTIHELAENGGLYDAASDCGDYLGYSIWYDKDTECYPKNIENQFILTYDRNLDAMLSGIIAPGNFEYTIMQSSQLRIAGASTAMLEFPISSKTGGSIIRTETCPVPELQQIPDSLVCTATRCQLMPEVTEKLARAQQIAQNRGYQLQVTSAYRTYEDQAAMRARKGEMAALPSCTAPHVTGRAVDVVLKGQPYMTSAGNPTADMSLGKRQELEAIMCEAGFVRYAGEFWHYEYGTSRWERGKAAGVCAIV
jgi:D-alanyl-D-alanine dipeptidase